MTRWLQLALIVTGTAGAAISAAAAAGTFVWNRATSRAVAKLPENHHSSLTGAALDVRNRATLRAHFGLEHISEAELRLPPRREILDLAESRELRAVDATPGTRVIADEG